MNTAQHQAPIGRDITGQSSKSAAWIGRAAFALADQSSASALTFAVNVLLARWLPPEQYGAFAIGFAVFLLAAAIHTGTLVDPLLVFGANRYASTFRPYVHQLLRAHLALTSAIAAALLGVSGFLMLLGQGPIASSLAGLAIASPALLLPALMRRAYYAIERTHVAALAGVMHLALSLAGLYMALLHDLLSPAVAFIVLALAGIPSTVALVRGLRRLPPVADRPPTLGEVVAVHWSYARWGSTAILINWIPANGALLALAAFGNVTGAAVVRAMLNLIQPPLLLQQSVASAAVPGLARRGVRNRGAIAHLFELAAGFVGVAIAFAAAAWLVSAPVVSAVYDGRYDGALPVLSILVLIPMLCALTGTATIVLQATEEPRGIAVGWAGAALVSATLGVVLASRYGALGASWGMVAAYVAAALIMSAAAKRAVAANGARGASTE